MAGIIGGGSSVAEGELRTVVAGGDGEGTSKQRQQAGMTEPARSGGGGGKNGGGGGHGCCCACSPPKLMPACCVELPMNITDLYIAADSPCRPSPPASVARAPPPPPLESHCPQLHSSWTAATATRSSPVVVVIAFCLGARATSAVARPHPRGGPSRGGPGE
uniref:Uncharacterized protein n=1 Tax=Oryza glumipatula TaxID=40148 RepID=A0A0D9Y8L0_9ORYZ